MPREALAELAGVITVLKLVPWNGESVHERNPEGPLRRMIFGGVGMVVYLILEDQRRVDLVNVMWLG